MHMIVGLPGNTSASVAHLYICSNMMTSSDGNISALLEINKWFHPTTYNGCNYLSMLGLKLIHGSESGPRYHHYNPYHRSLRPISITFKYLKCIFQHADGYANFEGKIRRISVSIYLYIHRKVYPQWHHQRIKHMEHYLKWGCFIFLHFL